jgi:hypothetical protein
MPVKRRLPKARAFVPSPELLKLYRRARFLESNDGVYSWDGHLTDEYRELRDRIDTLCGFALGTKTSLMCGRATLPTMPSEA